MFKLLNMPSPRKLSTAWVNFNGQGTVSIRDDLNVTSITDLGVGIYRINWDNGVFANANYVVNVNAPMEYANQDRHIAIVRNTSTTIGRATFKTTAGLEVVYAYSTIAYADPQEFYCTAFGGI